MAQSAITVTPPNPTPPTNMSFTGTTAPNPPNYSKNLYIDWKDNTNIDTPANNPFYDDGTAGTLTLFAANLAALTQGVGSAATAGGTEGTYPGTAAGAVPASTSVAHEAAGTEVVVTAPGSRAVAPTATVSVFGNWTGSPNADHASSENVAPTAAPTITGLLPVAPVGNGGTTPLTVNGTNFRNGAVVYIAGTAYPTQFNSATQLLVQNAPKRTSAGNTAITVRVGTTTTAATNWVFS